MVFNGSVGWSPPDTNTRSSANAPTQAAQVDKRLSISGLRQRGVVDDVDEQPSPEQLHAVRIKAKRCRYASEAVAPAVGKKAARLASAVADVQSLLGDHHDAHVAEEWLRDKVAGADVAHGVAAGELIALQRLEAAELPSAEYEDNRGRPKLVRYWAMGSCEGEFRPTSEVDEIRWLASGDARRQLSYDRDRAVLDALDTRES